MTNTEAPTTRIAVNVMRSRLTVIGFNIAVVSFQLSSLYDGVPGGINLSGIDHPIHIGAQTALLMAMALSMIAIVLYLVSGAMDQVGVCNHWTFLAGDLFMYFALAQTVSGFFAPLESAILVFAQHMPDRMGDIAILNNAILFAGGTSWFFASYIGPIVSLARSPFTRSVNIGLMLGYLLLLGYLCWLAAHAASLDSADRLPLTAAHLFIELLQPLRW